MIYTNLDIIVRRTLLEVGLPIHWYSEFLFHSSTCLRELTIEVLKVINTRNLPIGEQGEIDLPEDFLDDVMLSFDSGATLRGLPHKESINPLRVHSTTTGQFENQPASVDLNNVGLFFPFVGYTWYWNISDYGESTGRIYGAGGGTSYGYKVIKERRQIQVYGITEGNAILQYISDGQSIDNATMVDTQAFMTIQKYIIWQRSPNASNMFSPEGNMYRNEKRKLKARMSDLTDIDIKNIFRKSYMASIKN